MSCCHLVTKAVCFLAFPRSLPRCTVIIAGLSVLFSSLNSLSYHLVYPLKEPWCCSFGEIQWLIRLTGDMSAPNCCYPVLLDCLFSSVWTWAEQLGVYLVLIQQQGESSSGSDRRTFSGHDGVKASVHAPQTKRSCYWQEAVHTQFDSWRSSFYFFTVKWTLCFVAQHLNESVIACFSSRVALHFHLSVRETQTHHYLLMDCGVPSTIP